MLSLLLLRIGVVNQGVKGQRWKPSMTKRGQSFPAGPEATWLGLQSAQLFPSCVTLGKLLHFSVQLTFLVCKLKIEIISFLGLLGRLTSLMEKLIF